MQNGNNFASAGKKYLESKKIKENSIENLEQKGLIKYDQEFISFVMKDLDGNIIGEQERFLNPKGKLKSKTKQGSKVGYFYTTIDWLKPIIIVEGEIDWASVLDLPNVIGLQGIANFRKLVIELKEKGVSEIHILVDKDHSANTSIGKILDMDQSFLENVFDCRELLGDHKDINEYICNGGNISIDNIYENKKSIGEFKRLVNSFLVGDGKQSINHNEFAQYLIKKHHIASSNENLFIYSYRGNKGIWKYIDKQSMKKLIMTELQSWLSFAINNIKVNDQNNIFEFILTNSKDFELEESLVLSNENDICLYDGILDIKSMDFREYALEDYKFQKLPYSINVFDNYVEPKKFLNFLGEILEGHENKNQIVSFVQEFIGWLFIASTKFQKSLLIHGTGANGKGVLLNIIKNIIGQQSCSSIGLNDINKEQYLYHLVGKLVNIDSDMQQNVQLDSGNVKKLISGETIMAKTVYKQPIEFIPYARLLIATNELPYLKTIDNAIKRRFVFLHLKQSFYGRENPNLVKEILEEKENIFVWAICGLERLIKRDDFDIPKELENEIIRFIKENDTVEQFFEEGIIEEDLESKISLSDLYMLYKIFCSDSGYKALGKKNFSKRIEERGFVKSRNGKKRYFVGIKQNNPF